MTLNRKELCGMIGKNIPMQELQDTLFELGLETEEANGDEATFEINQDRPDLLSVEGVARLLRFHYGIDKKMHIPAVRKSGLTFVVEGGMQKIRPYIVGAVVRDITITDALIKSLMQIQEKLHGSFGRDRRKGAIGIHDFDKISGSTITYKAVDPDGDDFVPLGKKERMTLRRALREHEKGGKYGYILEGFSSLPTIYDDDEIFSFPPIINGAKTEVTTRTRNLLIEVTGEDRNTIERMLNIVLYLLSDRGGGIYSVTVRAGGKTEIQPRFKAESMRLPSGYVNTILGTNFSISRICSLLDKSGLGHKLSNKDIVVLVPPYRVDILHKRDLVDDIGRAYSFNRMRPTYPKTQTIGELSANTKFNWEVREILVGFGFQDLLNFMLTDKESNYRKMNIEDDGKAVELGNPYSEQYTIVRTWLLPSLMEVLSNNTNRQYPQNLSEVGQVMELDEEKNLGCTESWRAAAVLCGVDAQYNNIKSELQAIASAFGTEIKTPPTKHLSFIEGRCASVIIGNKEVGVIGEINPVVLKRWGIEMPAATFEIEVDALR